MYAYVYVCVYVLCATCLPAEVSQKRASDPLDGCDPLCGCWELN